MASITTVVTAVGNPDVGDEVTLTATVRDDAGATTNAPTLTVAVTKPDGTAISPAPTVTNTAAGGIYTAQLTTAQVNAAGEWTGAWTSAGLLDGPEPFQFTVFASRALVASLDALKGHLRNVTTREDARLREVLAAVTDIMEPAVGSVVVRTYTEWHDVRGPSIVPRHKPPQTVTSITPYLGAALDSSAYVVDTELWEIRLRWPIWGRYQVVLTAGHSPWPSALKLAGLIVAQHEWRVRNGNGGRPAPDADPLEPVPGSGYLVPRRALELMRPWLDPGIG